MRRLLFYVSAKDLDVQTFCTGGAGGQHRNAKRNGVRIRHRASGAVAEHRDGRDQGKNRAEAFRKMAESAAFKAWRRGEVLRLLGLEDEARAETEKQLAPGNLRVEVQTPAGWRPEGEE